MNAIENARRGYNIWKKLGFEARAHVLVAVAHLLERDKNNFARLMAHEMGKPITEGRAEIEKCAWACNYFAEHGPTMLGDDIRASNMKMTFVRYEPLGPILAIMPWNYPFWQFFRMAAPALIAGNSILLKHSLNTPKCAEAIENLFIEAKAPKYLVTNLVIAHEEIPEIISDSRVKAVTLTGSTRAGAIVGELAGRNLKKIVLELGGSDPFIILPDAKIEEVARFATHARCQNSGQSCIASKRFIVHASILDNFLKYFVKNMQNLILGDPLSEKTQIGPLASKSQQLLLDSQVRDAQAKGAKTLCGGVLPSGPQSYYPPTVLTNITNSMRVYHEEVFGPVACVYSFENIQDALELANITSFGLSSSIWTTKESEALELVNDLEFGSVFINAIPRSDPRLPFGGIKDSGYGHELGREGLMEFVNQKVVSIADL